MFVYYMIRAMDWNSELCLRSMKRRRSYENMPDHLTKVSRLAISSRIPTVNHLNHQKQNAVHCDFSAQSDVFQLIPQSDTLSTCNGMHILPVNNDLSHLDIYIPLNHKKPEFVKDNQALPESERNSNDEHISETFFATQKNQHNPHQLSTSMIFPSETEKVYKNNHTLSNDRSCPDCAAGQSGHIRHIGRWRLMDSL